MAGQTGDTTVDDRTFAPVDLTAPKVAAGKKKAWYFCNKIGYSESSFRPSVASQRHREMCQHKYNSFNTALHQFKRPLISNLGQLQKKHAYLSQIVISMDYYLYNNHDFDHGISKWNGTKRSVHYHKCEEPRNKRRIKMFRITL